MTKSLGGNCTDRKGQSFLSSTSKQSYSQASKGVRQWETTKLFLISNSVFLQVKSSICMKLPLILLSVVFFFLIKKDTQIYPSHINIQCEGQSTSSGARVNYWEKKKHGSIVNFLLFSFVYNEKSKMQIENLTGVPNKIN